LGIHNEVHFLLHSSTLPWSIKTAECNTSLRQHRASPLQWFCLFSCDPAFSIKEIPDPPTKSNQPSGTPEKLLCNNMPTPNAASPEEATNNSVGAETTRNSISAGEISTTQDSVSTETIPSTTIPVPHFSQIPSSHTPLSSSALAVNLDRESIAVNL